MSNHYWIDCKKTSSCRDFVCVEPMNHSSLYVTCSLTNLDHLKISTEILTIKASEKKSLFPLNFMVRITFSIA